MADPERLDEDPDPTFYTDGDGDFTLSIFKTIKIISKFFCLKFKQLFLVFNCTGNLFPFNLIKPTYFLF